MTDFYEKVPNMAHTVRGVVEGEGKEDGGREGGREGQGLREKDQKEE